MENHIEKFSKNSNGITRSDDNGKIYKNVEEVVNFHYAKFQIFPDYSFVKI
jgi:hypothetical protein